MVFITILGCAHLIEFCITLAAVRKAGFFIPFLTVWAKSFLPAERAYKGSMAAITGVIILGYFGDGVHG